MTPRQGGWPKSLVLALVLVASLSGVLFGYDASSINDACVPSAASQRAPRRLRCPRCLRACTHAAYSPFPYPDPWPCRLPLIKDEFGLSESMEGIVVSVLLLGAVVGALLAGIPADRIGRRLTILISGVLFIVGCILASFLARNVALLIIGRIIIGAAIGVTSAVTPMFIAELAPPVHRGGLVMAYQLSITIGILVALGIGHALYDAGNWRLMIFLAVVPAGLQMFGLIFVPESPRFLVSRGRRDMARAVLVRIRGSEAAADAEMAEIEAVREEEGRVTWRDVFGPRYRGPMAAGIGLAVISAWCGINAIVRARPVDTAPVLALTQAPRSADVLLHQECVALMP